MQSGNRNRRVNRGIGEKRPATPPAIQATPSGQARYREVGELSEWLQSGAWSHYVTLTFREKVSSLSAEKAFRAWIRRLESVTGSPVAFFGVVGEGPRGGKQHVHAVVAHPRLTVAALKRQWRAGVTTIRQYDASGGACVYIANHVMEEGAEYSTSDTWPTMKDKPASATDESVPDG